MASKRGTFFVNGIVEDLFRVTPREFMDFCETFGINPSSLTDTMERLESNVGRDFTVRILGSSKDYFPAIYAIKSIREVTGQGLKESKDALDSVSSWDDGHSKRHVYGVLPLKLSNEDAHKLVDLFRDYYIDANVTVA